MRYKDISFFRVAKMSTLIVFSPEFLRRYPTQETFPPHIALKSRVDPGKALIGTTKKAQHEVLKKASIRLKASCVIIVYL